MPRLVMMMLAMAIASEWGATTASAQPADAAAPRALMSPLGGQDGAAGQSADQDDEADGPGRRKLWTGIGLTMGGAVYLVQSYVFFRDGCAPADEVCRGRQRAYRMIGGSLAVSGVTVLVIDRLEKRRGPRVALGIAPRAVRMTVSY